MDAQSLEERFSQFILFGGVFDTPTRRHLVHFLHAHLQGLPVPEAPASNPYLGQFKEALGQMLAHPGLRQAVAASDALAGQVIDDLLRWMRKTDRKVQEGNPHADEQRRFQAWSHRPTFLWRESWPELLQFLRAEYPPEQLDAGFYAKKFKELMPGAPKTAEEQALADAQPAKSPLDLAIDALLAQWDALLTAKVLRHELEQIDRERETFCQLLYAKVDEFLRVLQLVSPVAMEAGRFWDLSRGLWKDAGFEVLEQYRRLLESEEAVRELVDLLGRMREAEIEMEEETFAEVLVRQEWVPDARLRSEVVGLHGSADLSRMLPSEAAFLADDDTALAFYQRYAEQQLLSFQYAGKRLVSSQHVNHISRQKQRRKEKGPFILCIDTSGSMHGLPAQIAKTICFAIMKMAAQERRKCYLISFSVGIKTINLLDLANSLDKVAEFLAMSFDGGTDVSPALSEALDMLHTSEYREGDVLMVSDFVMFEIRKELLERIRREQGRDTRFHSLTIGKRPNPEVLAHFDNCWVYDPDTRGIARQLARDLHGLRR